MSEKFFEADGEHHARGPFGDRGDETFTFDIPAGRSYSALTLSVDEDRGGASIVSEPAVGQTGGGAIVVHWWYDGAGGRVRFHVEAYGDPVSSSDGGPGGAPSSQVISGPVKSHFPSSAFDLRGMRGDDAIQIALPEGYSFRRAWVEILQATFGGARIAAQPAVGDFGTLTFDGHWWYNARGKIRYLLEVEALNDQAGELVAQFDGTATVTTSSALAPGPFSQSLTLHPIFNAERTKVNLGPFPEIDQTVNRVTARINELDGGTGSFDNAAGTASIPIALRVDNSFNPTPSTVDLVLTTGHVARGSFAADGAPLDRGTGAITFVGVGAFQGGVLDGSDCLMVVSGTLAPLP
jgi:hypothetical protein